MTATPTVDREALRRKSAPLLLCERARAQPDAIAFRCKHLGLYRERSWRDYAALVARTARAFAELGLARGERVAIMGDACEQWLICDLAAQSLGAIVYGIYPTASAAEVEYQLRDGGAVMFIAENQEYVAKILPFADGLNELKWIVVVDDSASQRIGGRDKVAEAATQNLLDKLKRLKNIEPIVIHSGSDLVASKGEPVPPRMRRA